MRLNKENSKTKINSSDSNLKGKSASFLCSQHVQSLAVSINKERFNCLIAVTKSA